VNAQQVVFDPSNFMANYSSLGEAVKQVVDMMTQINNQRVQIMNQIEQIRYQEINTRNFDYLIGLKRMMGEIDKSVKDTLGGVDDLEKLHDYFEAMYPDLRSMDPRKVNELNIDAMQKKQYKAARDAIEEALKAQTTINQIPLDQDENTKLLARNKAVEGQKQVAQITNEYLSMLCNKIDRLTTVIAAQYKADSTYFQNEIQQQEQANMIGQQQRQVNKKKLQEELQRSNEAAKRKITFSQQSQQQ
jgi:P-type conjugative transfer protein TrbJ